MYLIFLLNHAHLLTHSIFLYQKYTFFCFEIIILSSCAADGKNEVEAFRRARAVTKKAKKPLIVHHTFSSIPHEGPDGALGGLCSGDIYTHSLHGFPSSLIQVSGDGARAAAGRDGAAAGGDGAAAGGDGAAAAAAAAAEGSPKQQYTVRQAAREARDRGVLFDVGHGAGSFSWKVAEICAKENFFPDTISTDLHIESCGSPCYDLCIAASKMLHVGMSLFDVIAAMTSTPAHAIGWDDRIGSFTNGCFADVTVLRRDVFAVPIPVEDCQGQLRMMKKRLRAVAVFKNGRSYPVMNTTLTFPKYCQTEGALERWKQLIVRDEEPPNFSNVLPVPQLPNSSSNGEITSTKMRPSKRAKNT